MLIDAIRDARTTTLPSPGNVSNCHVQRALAFLLVSKILKVQRSRNASWSIIALEL